MKNKTINRIQRILLIAAFGLATQAVFSQTAFVANPSFEFDALPAYPGYSPVTDWPGAYGLNNNSGPFSNAGTPIADQSQAAFIQHNGTMMQTISGLTTNNQYWLQFWFLARNCCGGQGSLTVLFNGTQIATIPNVQNMDTNYQFMNVPFTPTVTNGVLEFQLNESAGDLTVNLDAVNIVQRGTNDVVLMNPSFEASGPPGGDAGEVIGPTNNMAGWTWDTNGTGMYGISLIGGTYADNGAIPDQELVGFISGPGSLSQTVSRLFVGTNYQLSFFYNAQMAPGTNAQMQVTANGVLLDNESVAPVGGSNPYNFKSVSFTPTNSTVTISFAQTNSTATLLLDNIRLIGAVAPVYSMAMSPSALDLNKNQISTVQVTVPQGYLSSSPPFQVNVSLGNTNVAQIVGAGAGGVLTLNFQGTTNVQTFQVMGLSRGATVVQAVVPAGLIVAQLTGINVFTSFVLNPSFEDALAGFTPIPGWSGGATVEDASGPDYDNGMLPDRTQLAVLQGSNSLSQQIFNLTPGNNYWLQFEYNASSSDSQSGANGINLKVQLGGQVLATINNILPAGSSVGDVPFYFTNLTFLPTNASELLEFDTTPTVAGTTPALLLDAVSMVQRDTKDIVIENPSFEASGEGPGPGYLSPPMAGWQIYGPNGSGINWTPGDPFGDNGLTPDQGEVVWINRSGTATATINNLIPNQVYTLSYAVNQRQYGYTVGTTSLVYSVTFGDLNLLTDQLLYPVGDDNPFQMQYLVFTNDAASQQLQFSVNNPGSEDVTFLLDNVRLQPGIQMPPHPQLSATMSNGQVIISWPSWPVAVAGSVLQQTSALPGPWINTGAIVTMQGNTNVVTVTPSNPSMFYRLNQ